MTRRLAAVGALAFAVAALALAIGVFVSSFPNGLTVFVCLAGAVAAGWYEVTHRACRAPA